MEGQIEKGGKSVRGGRVWSAKCQPNEAPVALVAVEAKADASSPLRSIAHRAREADYLIFIALRVDVDCLNKVVGNGQRAIGGWSMTLVWMSSLIGPIDMQTSNHLTVTCAMFVFFY